MKVMMKMNDKVKLLDCTLRDGGFVNNWKFGYNTINTIFNRLDSAEVDIIEMGFINKNTPFDMHSTIQPDTESFKKVFSTQKVKCSLKVGMIDFGTCPIENVSDCKSSIFDGIRVIFKKSNIDEALEFCRQIKDKGYKLFIQPVSITSYTDYEILDLISKVNSIKPYTFSIVDTYGLLHREKLFRYFYLMDSNLCNDIYIGYHSHNNFQLAYSNSIEILSINTERTIVLDGSCYGMGKGAGNANIELLALFLNENCNKHYKIDYILEVIDVNIMPIYQQHYWGYSFKYFLAASNDCHPNYVTYLVNKKTLSVKLMNELLDSIEDERKLIYDEQYIEQKYMEYQKQIIDDTQDYKKLTMDLANKKILLLAPGSTVRDQQNNIQRVIDKEKPVIISVNFLPKEYIVDYIFVSNVKRYMQLSDRKHEISDTQKIILTSNIEESAIKANYIFNYDTLLNRKDKVKDTSMLMLLKLLEKIGVKEVTMAGFDGFSENGTENYFDKDFMFELDMKSYQIKNDAINDALKELEHIDIHFITKSVYKEKE